MENHRPWTDDHYPATCIYPGSIPGRRPLHCAIQAPSLFYNIHVQHIMHQYKSKLIQSSVFEFKKDRKPSTFTENCINSKVEIKNISKSKKLKPGSLVLPGVLGNMGKRAFISGEQGNKGQILRGTGIQIQYWETRNIRKQIIDFWGTGEQANLFQQNKGPEWIWHLAVQANNIRRFSPVKSLCKIAK